MSSDILAVTGMHRSGTSLLSHYLSECNLPVGKTLLDGGVVQSGSKGGHHEDKEFVDFHEEILRANRSSIFVTQEKKLPLKINPRLHRRAADLIAARKNWPQWGWKDPRTTLFLDFWADVSEQIKFLFIFREPLQVVDSLIRRGRDPIISKNPVVALQSWLVYNQQILSFFKQYPARSILIEVENFIEDPNRLAMTLAKQFQFEIEPVPLENLFSANSFKRSLSPVSEELAKDQKNLLLECQSVYQTLRSHANLKL
jgi:hypothetical protein